MRAGLLLCGVFLVSCKCRESSQVQPPLGAVAQVVEADVAVAPPAPTTPAATAVTHDAAVELAPPTRNLLLELEAGLTWCEAPEHACDPNAVKAGRRFAKDGATGCDEGNVFEDPAEHRAVRCANEYYGVVVKLRRTDGDWRVQSMDFHQADEFPGL